MRVFNRGLVLLIALLLLWGVGGYAFYRFDRMNSEADYRLLTDLIIHKRELAEATPSPRIVIAGGSNAYYGIDTHILADRLGTPVVNVALPFGAYHHRINIALLEALIRPGDIVLFSDANFWHGIAEDAWRVRRKRGFDTFLLDSHLPGYGRQFTEYDLPWMALPAMRTLLLDVVDSFSPPEGRSWVIDTDSQGNYTGCIPAPVVAPEGYVTDAPNTDLAAALRAAAQRFESKGARLIVTPPQMLIRERERERWLGFRARALGLYEPAVPVIAADPQDLLRSERGDFCDSAFHLSGPAARARSETLAAALQPYVPSRESPAHAIR